MSRVPSKAVKSKALQSFFDRFPTPSDAYRMAADDAFEIMKPLGLFPNRLRASTFYFILFFIVSWFLTHLILFIVTEITKSFLTAGPSFQVGLDKAVKIYGVGRFGVESYRIFCLGMYDISPDDRNLAAYCRWATSDENAAILKAMDA